MSSKEKPSAAWALGRAIVSRVMFSKAIRLFSSLAARAQGRGCTFWAWRFAGTFGATSDSVAVISSCDARKIASHHRLVGYLLYIVTISESKV